MHGHEYGHATGMPSFASMIFKLIYSCTLIIVTKFSKL